MHSTCMHLNATSASAQLACNMTSTYCATCASMLRDAVTAAQSRFLATALITSKLWPAEHKTYKKTCVSLYGKNQHAESSFLHFLIEAVSFFPQLDHQDGSGWSPLMRVGTIESVRFLPLLQLSKAGLAGFEKLYTLIVFLLHIIYIVMNQQVGTCPSVQLCSNLALFAVFSVSRRECWSWESANRCRRWRQRIRPERKISLDGEPLRPSKKKLVVYHPRFSTKFGRGGRIFFLFFRYSVCGLCEQSRGPLRNGQCCSVLYVAASVTGSTGSAAHTWPTLTKITTQQKYIRISYVRVVR